MLFDSPIFLSLSPVFNLSLSHCCSQSLADGRHEDGGGLCAAEPGGTQPKKPARVGGGGRDTRDSGATAVAEFRRCCPGRTAHQIPLL